MTLRIPHACIPSVFPFSVIVSSYSEPDPTDGMTAFADGVMWDPLGLGVPTLVFRKDNEWVNLLGGGVAAGALLITNNLNDLEDAEIALMNLGIAAQVEGTWEAGVGTQESVTSPAKVAAAIAALAPSTNSAGSGTELQYRNAGAFGAVAGTSWASNQLLIAAQDAAVTPLAIRAAPSQTANGFELQDSAGNEYFGVRADGAIKLRDHGPAHPPTIKAAPSGYGGAGAIYFGGRTGRETRIGMSWAGGTSGVHVQSNGGFYISPTGDALSIPDVGLKRLAAGIWAVRGGESGGAGLNLQELSADPADPPEGTYTQWMSDGTGSGDDGDIMVKITAGGVTKTATLIDFSALP